MLDSNAPMTLEDYKGQPKAKRKLGVHIKAAQMQNRMLEHVLISGQSGLGKSCLCNIIANEFNASMKTVLCSGISKAASLIESLISVQEGEILFLDEIHALSIKMQEVLYPVLEKGVINAEIDGEVLHYDLPHFTIVAATTDLSDVATPLRNRFPITVELAAYKADFIEDIVRDTAKYYNLKIEDSAAKGIALCARGVPRKAKALVHSCRDYAIVLNDGVVDEGIAGEALEEEGLDIETGLSKRDMRYLESLVKKFRMKAVGIDLLASSIGEPKGVVENIIEPYLIQNDYVIRTPRGRKASEKAFKLFEENNG